MFISTTPVFAAAAVAFILNCSAAPAQMLCNPQNGKFCFSEAARASYLKNYDAVEARAKAKITQGNFKDALTDLDSLFDAQKPGTVAQLTFMRAEALLGMGDFVRADEAIRAAENADQDLNRKVGLRHYYFIRGAIFQGIDPSSWEAEQAYSQAAELPATNQIDAAERHDQAFSYYNLASIIGSPDAERMGNVDKFLQMQSDNGDGYFLRGQLKAGLGDYDSAIADYDRAGSLKTSGDLNLFRGIAYVKKADAANTLENLANAIKDLTTSIAAHPDSEPSYLQRGIAYIRMSDAHPDYIKLGFADFDMAQKLNSDDIDVYSNRGEFHLFFARKNPKIRVAEASLAAADYQEVLRRAKSYPFTGSALYVELAEAQLEQTNKLLGEAAKSKK
jgi:tetratricopeptide (TPR) repeat protein